MKTILVYSTGKSCKGNANCAQRVAFSENTCQGARLEKRRAWLIATSPTFLTNLAKAKDHFTNFVLEIPWNFAATPQHISPPWYRLIESLWHAIDGYYQFSCTLLMNEEGNWWNAWNVDFSIVSHTSRCVFTSNKTQTKVSIFAFLSPAFWQNVLKQKSRLQSLHFFFTLGTEGVMKNKETTLTVISPYSRW